MAESHSVESNSLQPHGCSPPSSSVHGILQARTLEWAAEPSSRESFPGIKPRSPESLILAGRFFTTEPLGKPQTLICYAWILISGLRTINVLDPAFLYVSQNIRWNVDHWLGFPNNSKKVSFVYRSFWIPVNRIFSYGWPLDTGFHDSS